MADPRPLQHLGFALVRTPALPMRTWLAHAANRGDSRTASARALFRRPLVEQAIYIASPSFHARLKRWDWTVRDAEGRKMLASFERYLNRMCFRATPFGLFSTISHAPLVPGHGRWSLDEAADQARIERAVRIDGEALYAICDKLHNCAPGPDLRYVVNASLYRVGAAWRFIDWSTAGHGERTYQLGGIDSHPLVDTLIARMRDRPLDRAGIAGLVSEEALAEDIDLPALVDDLVAARVLLPAVSLDPLNTDPGGALLRALPAAHTALAERLHELVVPLRSAPHDHALEYYMAADREIRTLTGAEPAGLAVQVDAFRAHASMAMDAAPVQSAVDALDWLMDRFSVRKGPLDQFCAAFEHRYGSGMVPLMEALDPESGIGFGAVGAASPLIASLGIRRRAAQAAQVTLSPLDQLLLTLIQRDPSLLARREIEIERTDAIALPLTREGNDGNGMAAVLHFPWTSCDGEQSSLAVLAGMDGEGSTSWVSRFGHAEQRLDEAALAHAREVEAHSGPDVVHAEIGYLPRAHAVNVMSRQCAWSWRIDLAEAAIEPGDNALPVADLMVRVVGRDVELWSRRLQKRVVPHLTAAHRTDDPYNPAVYRFLCAAGSHGMRIPRLSWGTLFRNFDYLPRLRFESLVLTAARWRVRHGGVPSTAPELRALLAKRGIPRYVELEERDNRLMLDLDDELDVEQVLRIAKKGRDLVLLEVLEDLERAGAPDAAPGWRHEVVVPLYRPAQARCSAAPATTRDLAPVPLAEALYVKLYGGQETLDKRVLPEVAAWIARQRQHGSIDNWFFIRYAEHGWHLRLRVFPAAGRSSDVLCALVGLVEQLRQRGLVSRFEFATYEREMIRYGGEQHIGANEALFGIDSDLAAAMLDGAAFAGAEQPERWSMAVLAIDALLRDFGLPLDRKAELAARIAASFKDEFKLAGQPLAALGAWYRRHARDMLAALRRDERAPPWSRQLWQLFDAAAPRRGKVAAALHAADPQLRMVESQVHMLCNRLFMAQNREFEVLVYDFLARSYRALAAMQGDQAR